MAPPNIRPLTIEELNALYLRVINNEGFLNVLSEIEYHSNEFVHPEAQEYIRRMREYIDEGGSAQLIQTDLLRLLRSKIYPMEGLIPFDRGAVAPPRHGGRRRKHRKTRSKTRKTVKRKA